MVGSGLVCQPRDHAGRPVHHFEESLAIDDAGQFGELFYLPARLRISPLNRRFGWAPASVLHAADRRWQARKRQWLELGIESEVGRAQNLLGLSEQARVKGGNGTSIFDPVICELVYRWWCPAGGAILDPFAGGSVRGIVAGVFGLGYAGIELRREQVGANRVQVRRPSPRELRKHPEWVEGDALEELPRLEAAGRRFDMVFTCPPYFDLERYSDDPVDLLGDGARRLRGVPPRGDRAERGPSATGPLRVWVVGDVRGPSGTLRGLPSIVIEAPLSDEGPRESGVLRRSMLAVSRRRRRGRPIASGRSLHMRRAAPLREEPRGP